MLQKIYQHLQNSGLILVQIGGLILYSIASIAPIEAQDKSDKAVVLIEEKLPKRTILFAKNNTDREKSIFLKVNPTGYRRSSARPMIKTIPANSQVAMITLIPLKNTKASYTYNLIVNEDQERAIRVNYSQGEKKQANVADIMNRELVVFIKDNCVQCEKLMALLHKKYIKFRPINVNDRNRFYAYFWDRLEKDGYDKNAITVPVVVDQGKLRYPVTDIEGLVKVFAERKKQP